MFIFHYNKINKEEQQSAKEVKDENDGTLKDFDTKFYNYFKRDSSTPKFSRTVKEIFESKTFSGCSDIGLMSASILREKNIPTIYVETASVDWLNKVVNNLAGNDVMEGHIFLEIFISNKWYLYDPTRHIVYDNYDNTNNNYPKRYYAFAKGFNSNSLGVYNTKDERKLALDKLKYYDYNQYIDPKYKKIDLNN